MIGSILYVQTVSATLATADLVLTWLWIAGDHSTLLTLGYHFVILGIIGSVALVFWPHQRMQTANSLLLGFVLGPVGGLFLLILDLDHGDALASKINPAKRATAPSSTAELLHAEILQGRRHRAGREALIPFAEVFASGTLQRQQKAIAAISLSYRPEMLPALRLALASDVPAIRVQAAAVYAKLRGSFDDRAKAVRAAAVQGPLTRSVAEEAEAVAASGFIDKDSANELRALARRVTLTTRSAPPLPRKGALVRPPPLKRYACGGIA